jgi:membrane protein YqaA with SNARE-associated domain
MDDLAVYGGLFVTALLAATVLPAQSEAVLGYLDATGAHDARVLLLVATTGNVLGSVVNWVMGRYLVHFKERRWFPIKPAHIDRATAWFNRWGLWSLLLAWAPFIGDPLTFVAGILRVGFWPFLLLVAAGKAARYAVVLAVA